MMAFRKQAIEDIKQRNRARLLSYGDLPVLDENSQSFQSGQSGQNGQGGTTIHAMIDSERSSGIKGGVYDDMSREDLIQWAKEHQSTRPLSAGGKRVSTAV